MYWAWKQHHLTPSAFYDMKLGEKKVLLNFIDYEIEQMLEEQKQIQEKMGG